MANLAAKQLSQTKLRTSFNCFKDYHIHHYQLPIMDQLQNQKLLPSVSIAIPTYNEAEHIASVIQSFLYSQYPSIIEIIVADGGSNDETQKIVNQLSLYDSRVKLIYNPLKIQATALNLALEQSQGEVFLRADAHCDYASDYVEKCIQALQESQAINVGGAQRFVAVNYFQAGISLASKSFLGSGGAKYRNPNYNGFADTVFLGCFWRKYIADISGYNAASTPNEDTELNIRLNQLEPDAIYISSQIKVWYYPRKNWHSLWMQYFQYGKSRYLTAIKYPHKLQLRGKIPFLTITTIILLSLWDLFDARINFYFTQSLMIFFMIPFIESLRLNWQYNKYFMQEIWRGNFHKKPSLFICWLYCAIAIITMNFAHFAGYGCQLLSNKINRLIRLRYNHNIAVINQILKVQDR